MGGQYANVGVADAAVDQSDRAYGLRSVPTRAHVQTYSAVVDVDVLVQPSPIPAIGIGQLVFLSDVRVHSHLVDSRHGVVESQVAHGELLIAKGRAVETAVKDEVVHETSRSGLNKDALMLCTSITIHLEYDVLKTGCLSCRPMNACDRA